MCLLGVLTFDGIIKLRTQFLNDGRSRLSPREKAVKIPQEGQYCPHEDSHYTSVDLGGNQNRIIIHS